MGETFYLAFPLVFERCGAYDEDVVHKVFAKEQLSGADSLDGLAEPHLVSDDGATGFGGETDTLFLVRVELCVEKDVELFVVVFFFHQLTSPDVFATVNDKVDSILVAPKIGIEMGSG